MAFESGEWWRDNNTILKTINTDLSHGSLCLQGCETRSGNWVYAIVWWFYGSSTLQLLFKDGEILIDKE